MLTASTVHIIEKNYFHDAMVFFRIKSSKSLYEVGNKNYIFMF